jgi:hypothetical protein
MRTRMKKLALLLSLLALGALGLVACGGGDDEDSAPEAKASADTTTTARACPDYIQGKLSELARKNVREQVQELKAKLSREQVQELKRDANTEAKLSREQVQELEREANTWARLSSRRDSHPYDGQHGFCNKYMGQPMCMRLACKRRYHCTPVSAAFQKSFADATVEDIKSERIVLAGWTDRPLYVAAVKFSNGEVVVFSGGDESFGCAGGGSACTWSIADEDLNRRFVQAAAPRE